MEVIFLDLVDSTSSEALRLLDEGIDHPVAIIARHQRKGRGSRGKSWIGGSGNLFISFGFPRKFLSQKELSLTPIKSALILANFLRDETLIKPMIKWPNDLLVDGRKVAGILCESSIIGSEVCGVCIGIGVNLNKSPEVSDCLVTNFLEITGNQRDFLTVGKSLADYFEVEFNKPVVFEKYNEFLPLKNMLLVGSKLDDAKIETGLFKSVNRFGELEYSSLTEQGGIKSVSSITQSMGLIIQKKSSLPLVIADVGNTSAKIRITGGVDLLASYSISYEFNNVDEAIFEDMREVVFEDLSEDISLWPIYFGSVNPPAAKKLTKQLNEYGFLGVEINKKTFRLKLGKYPPEQLGFDRIALMESFLADKFSLNQELNEYACLISFGTATTIDFLKYDGTYHGGMILPGLNLSAKTLNEHTALLPLVDFSDIVNKSISELSLGCDTSSSIENGLIVSQLGAIKEGINRVKNTFPDAEVAEMVVSGGGWSIIKSQFFDSFQEWDLKIIEGRYSALDGYQVLISNS